MNRIEKRDKLVAKAIVALDLKPGDTFTCVTGEAGCVVIESPDLVNDGSGNFPATDSEGVVCDFGVLFVAEVTGRAS